jgi:DNA-directed RNA polymerase subunit RPC12/RpoP
MPLNLTRPIRCSKCGSKFTRQVAQQRRCERCLPRWVKARRAAAPPEPKPARPKGKAAKRAAVMAEIARMNRELARKTDALTLAEFLAMECMHSVPVIDCREPWCRARIDALNIIKTGAGWRSRAYAANPVPHPYVLERPPVTSDPAPSPSPSQG